MFGHLKILFGYIYDRVSWNGETECADTFNISFSALFSLAVRRFFLALRLIFDAFNFAFSNAFDFKLVETFAVELPLALCLCAAVSSMPKTLIPVAAIMKVLSLSSPVAVFWLLIFFFDS